MRNLISWNVLAGALLLTSCFQGASSSKPKTSKETESSLSALDAIKEMHTSLYSDCGEGLPEHTLEELKEMTLTSEEEAQAEKLLQEIGEMAQQCAQISSESVLSFASEEASTCDPDCSWCPVKWYWCVYNGGACAGGDNKSCCKLGACGSKHHCKLVCKSSCGCDVPPMPSDGGGGGEEE